MSEPRPAPLPRPRPPADEPELLQRVHALAGRTVAGVAARFGLPVPPDLRRNKGWLGQLLEYALGASAASRAEPDFPQLGVELKTVPVDGQARPRQSTYVCLAPLDGSLGDAWEESWVRGKLARVLFVPIVQQGEEPLPERIVGAPLLWVPSAADDARLRSDWEEITERIQRGEWSGLHAGVGEVLQLRPKAAKHTDTTDVLDEDAEWVQTNPRGFYLRRSFTTELFARAFGGAGRGR